ncbi:MAG: hypothetical protein MUC28_00435 [Planctomycetes bacterium]|jgi:tetratricopeptide (TPR) repeat protein|nr:hypothetical protein [Planctomycetota bacterium]
MFNIIPLILILLSLSVIIVIVVRKFSILASLDVDSIPAEREAKFKEKIISNRLKRSFFKYYHKLFRILKPIADGGQSAGRWLFDKLVEFKENYNRDAAPLKSGAEAADKLFGEASELMRSEDWEGAEKKFIEIISFDSQNYRAFRELGNLYYLRKDYNEAKQSLAHALRLIEQNSGGIGNSPAAENEMGNGNGCLIASINYDLAEVLREIADLNGAMAHIKQALQLEPNNPRYLDIKLEISIINKDKIAALDAFEKLQAVNPENQKLAEWEKQISEL